MSEPNKLYLRQSSFMEEAVDKLDDVLQVVQLAYSRPDEVFEGVAFLSTGLDQIIDQPHYSEEQATQKDNDDETHQFDLQKFQAKKILLRDKLAFVLGIVLVWVTAYWLGSDKASFYKLYIALAIVLFGIRFVSYRLARTHYYLFDLCYFANLWLVIVLLKFPNQLMMNVLFAYNAGPMAWSIIAMRNSLVLHSMEKIITLFMHWYPALVSWTLRWYPEGQEDGDKDSRDATFFELVILPLIPYIAWLVFYYLKLFVFSADKIQQKGYDTVYHWMIKNEKHPMSKLVRNYPKRLQPIVYLGVHATLCWLAFLVSYIFYFYYWAHTIFLVFLSLVASWNGANYYFEIFAHRYILSLGLDLKSKKAS